MATVYDLKKEQQILLDQLYWIDEEDTESMIIKSQLALIEGSVERKLAYLSDVLAEAIALAQLASERRKIAQERLERKEKQAVNAEKKLREFILSVMNDFDIKQVKGDLLSISKYERDVLIQTDDFDIDKIPMGYVKETHTIDIDKKLINYALKNGTIIKGFELVKKETLRVS